MDPMFQDERISAYLDGQLSGDERVLFEDELSHNSELRQVVEELRGLHDSLQALPRHSLNDDFAQHVLRRAERAMLTAPATVNPAGPIAATRDAASNRDGEPTGKPVQPGSRFFGNQPDANASRSRRPWIWAAVAIAVGVMVMVLSPQSKKRDQIARLDKPPIAPDARNSDQKLSAPSAPQISAPAEQTQSFASSEKHSLRKHAHELAGEPSVANGSSSIGPFLDRRNLEDDSKSHDASPAIPREAKAAGDAVGGEGAAPLNSPAPGGIASSPDQHQREAIKRDSEQPDRPNDAGLADSPSPVPANIGPAPSDRLATARFGTGQKNLELRLNAANAGSDKDRINRAAARPDASLAASPLGRSDATAEEDQTPRSGEMIVGEWATTPQASKEMFQRLLARRGIVLNESPAANLALMSAVRSASSGKVAAGSPTAAASVDQVEQARQDAKANGVATAEMGPSPDTRTAATASPAPRPKSAVAKLPAPVAPTTPMPPKVARAPESSPVDSNLSPSSTESPKIFAGESQLGVAAPAGASGYAENMQSAAAPEPPAGEGSLEVVYVVGTRDQVLGLIHDMHARPQQYRRMALAAVVPNTAQNREHAAAVAAPSGEASHLPPAASKSLASKTAQSAQRLQVDRNAKRELAAPLGTGGSVDGATNASGLIATDAANLADNAVGDSESVAEFAEQPSGQGWAARMNLPPETEESLQRSLTARIASQRRSGRQFKQSTEQHEKGSSSDGSAANAGGAKDQAAEKATSGDELRVEYAKKGDLQSPHRGDEPMQAVFVFRAAPPAVPPSPAATTPPMIPPPPQAAASSPSTPETKPAAVAPSAPQTDKAGK